MAADRKREVKVAWVVWEGRDAHVREFEPFRDTPRPTVHCPECGGELRLKLGDENAWHAAHTEDADCALTDSEAESALHLMVKMHLAEQLRHAASLTLLEPCSAERSPRCAGTRTRTLAVDWNAVAVERRVGTRRPDVTLLRHGTDVAAVEVWAKHRVGRRKKKDLAALELPWVEVRASHELVSENAPWTAAESLPIVSSGPAPPWECPACQAVASGPDPREVEERRAPPPPQRVDPERRAAFAAAAKEQLPALGHSGVVIQRVFLFDQLMPRGRVHRDALVIADVHQDGKRLGAFAGFLSDQDVIAKKLEEEGPDGYLRLRDEGLRALAQRAPDHDRHDDTVNVPKLLDNNVFMEAWHQEGVDHRWPREGPLAPTSPWVVPWARSGVDYLDLVRFLFVRYWSGLPVRYRWSEKNATWFLPKVHAELAWRPWI